MLCTGLSLLLEDIMTRTINLNKRNLIQVYACLRYKLINFMILVNNTCDEILYHTNLIINNFN